jgi:myo-inositol 2-dehydrogenase/D-chiro-inositol 1-dehydrogenase
MRRYDPSYQDAKHQIINGDLGMPYMVKAVSLDNEAYIESCLRFCKTSGGIFIDCGSHDVDLMRWYLESEVEEVYALGATFKYPEFKEANDTENGVAMLRFENGAIGTIHVGRIAPHGYHIETEIIGTNGQIRVSGIPWKNRVMRFEKAGAVYPIVDHFPQRFDDAYRLEMVEFIQCIQQGRKPEITVYDGTAATVVTYAITESFHTGKPVKIKDFL